MLYYKHRPQEYNMRNIKPLNNNGSIAIKFELYGKTYKFTPIKGGKFNNPIDIAKASDVCSLIELDIRNGCFDTTLEKYKLLNSPTRLSGIPKGRNAEDAREEAISAALEVQGRMISVELWNSYVEFKRPSVSPSTLALDYTKVRNHLIRASKAGKLIASDFRQFMLENSTPASTKKVIQQLSACCDWALEEGKMTVNPFSGLANKIKLPKSSGTKEIESFSQDEQNQIINAFRNDLFNAKGSRYKISYYADFVAFLFFTGCRTSEAIGLTWKCISDDFSIIRFSEAVVDSEDGRVIKSGLKTQAERIVPTSIRVQELLKARKTTDCNPDDIVFPSLSNTWIDRHNFTQRQWKLVLEGLGIRHRKMYATRHTFITYALEQGMEVKDIAALVGNSPEIIYKNYAAIKKELRLPD